MNKVLLMGNLTRDPELKYLQSGTPVCNFGLALNNSWTDQQTGERREDTCFVEIEAWQKQAEVINEYFVKGSQILIEGSLKFESWETPAGEKRNRLKVRMQRFEFVGRRADGNSQQQRETPETAAPAPTTSTTGTDDDNIPF